MTHSYTTSGDLTALNPCCFVKVWLCHRCPLVMHATCTRCLWPMRQDLREAAALCRRSIPSRTGLGRVASELFYPPGDVAGVLVAA